MSLISPVELRVFWASALDQGIHQIHQLASHTADNSRQALDGITLLVERLQNLSRLINQFHD